MEECDERDIAVAKHRLEQIQDTLVRPATGPCLEVNALVAGTRDWRGGGSEGECELQVDRTEMSDLRLWIYPDFIFCTR